MGLGGIHRFEDGCGSHCDQVAGLAREVGLEPTQGGGALSI